MSDAIEVVPYDPCWPAVFAEEAEIIKRALGTSVIAVHHIGSTAVPGLAAKPKIDIIAVVKEAAAAIPALEKAGYNYRGEYNIPFHYGFSKRTVETNVNLHVYEEDNPEIELNLSFRDYLRTHPETLQEYATLKSQLIEDQASHEKRGRFFKGYTLRKDEFIKKVLKKGGFHALCMRFCTHDEEIVAAQAFRREYYQNRSNFDPFASTFDQKDHVHVIFYHGVDIIGYAHFELLPSLQAMMRMFILKATDPGDAIKRHFLALCNRWIEQKGYKCFS